MVNHNIFSDKLFLMIISSREKLQMLFPFPRVKNGIFWDK